MPTKIEWTQEVWSPVTGCAKVSPGCKHCYAERMHARLTRMGKAKYSRPFSEVVCHPDTLDIPRRWRKPRTIFVCSMSDLFNVHVPTQFIQRVFDTMFDCPRHTFQVLTKRTERMSAFLNQHVRWPRLPNVWVGTSVEDQKCADERIPYLQATSAAVRFLSVEPLLGPIEFGPNGLDGIDWVIAGGESGPGARPMDPRWVRTVRDQCVGNPKIRTAFFFKQWGGVNKAKAGRELDGRTWDEMPKGDT